MTANSDDAISKVAGLVKEKKAKQETDVAIHLRKECERLRTENHTLRDHSGFLKELIAGVKEALEASEPLPPVKFHYPKSKAEGDIVAAIKLSDWHIGQRTNPAETEGFGRFDFEIAQERVNYIAEKFLGWIHTHRQVFRIPRLVILGEADWISGDIHEELRRTNEFPIPVQTVKAGQLLAQFVSTLAPHFPEIVFSQVGADNHGRLQPRPQFKEKSTNSMSFMVYALCNALLEKHDNIEFLFAQGIKQLVDINGKKFLTEHGDTVKAWMGIPFYGMERYRGKEASKRMQTELGFDYMSCGHWHVPGVVSGNILTNGSLCGTDEFDHGCGRHADPAQVSFLVHRKYGIFDWTAWRPKR